MSSRFDPGSISVRPQKPWTCPFYGSMNGLSLKTLVSWCFGGSWWFVGRWVRVMASESMVRGFGGSLLGVEFMFQRGFFIWFQRFDEYWFCDFGLFWFCDFGLFRMDLCCNLIWLGFCHSYGCGCGCCIMRWIYYFIILNAKIKLLILGAL